MKHLKLAGTILTLSALAFANSANSKEGGWYLGVSGDLTVAQDSDLKDSVAGTIEYDLSGGGNIHAGYVLSDYLRLELEGGYHSLEFDRISASGVTNTDPSGSFKVTSIMANGYYDMPNSTSFTPYIGVGLGGAYLKLNRDTGLGNSEDSDNEFAYQAMVGVSYSPKTMPSTDWSIGYHYLGVSEPDFGTIKLDNLHTHSLQVGMKYHF